jgi:hypothetical protein
LLAANYLSFFEASYPVIILRREDRDSLGASTEDKQIKEKGRHATNTHKQRKELQKRASILLSPGDGSRLH